MNKLYKCVIFDFDGVIIDSHELQKKALKYSFNKVNRNGEPPYDEFFFNSGNSLENIFINLELPKTMISFYRKYCNEHIDNIELQKNIENLLFNLKINKIKCALCTGKDRSRTIKILKFFNIIKYFDVVICSDDVEKPKPYSDSVERIISDLNVLKKDTIFVGDSINDISCAKNSSINSVAVTWGDMNESDLIQFTPTYVVRSIEELEKILLK